PSPRAVDGFATSDRLPAATAAVVLLRSFIAGIHTARKTPTRTTTPATSAPIVMRRLRLSRLAWASRSARASARAASRRWALVWGPLVGMVRPPRAAAAGGVGRG